MEKRDEERRREERRGEDRRGEGVTEMIAHIGIEQKCTQVIQAKCVMMLCDDVNTSRKYWP